MALFCNALLPRQKYCMLCYGCMQMPPTEWTRWRSRGACMKGDFKLLRWRKGPGLSLHSFATLFFHVKILACSDWVACKFLATYDDLDIVHNDMMRWKHLWGTKGWSGCHYSWHEIKSTKSTWKPNKPILKMKNVMEGGPKCFFSLLIFCQGSAKMILQRGKKLSTSIL